MVYQFSLVSSIPNSQHQLTMQTLQALTGMNSDSIDLHYVNLRPKYPFKPEFQAGKVNQTEQHRIKLISKTATKPASVSSSSSSSQFYKMSIPEDLPHLVNRNKKWTLQISDIPIAGKKPTCQQNIYETCIVDSGAHDDLLGYLDQLGYQYEGEYWMKGDRFYYNNIVIELFRVWIDSDKLLDTTGTWLIKAYINIARATDLENNNKSQKELESLKQEVNGLFELTIPDRLSMDSTISSVK